MPINTGVVRVAGSRATTLATVLGNPELSNRSGEGSVCNPC